MSDSNTLQEKKGRFRIQELNAFKSIPVESTLHNSFKKISRFTVRTQDIHPDFDCPKFLVLVKENNRKEWVNGNSLSSVESNEVSDIDNSSSFINKENKRTKRIDSQSFTVNKTNDSYYLDRTERKYSDLILESNGFLLIPIERLPRNDFSISSIYQRERENEARKIETIDFQFLLTKQHNRYYSSYGLRKSINNSFSILIHNLSSIREINI